MLLCCSTPRNIDSQQGGLTSETDEDDNSDIDIDIEDRSSPESAVYSHHSKHQHPQLSSCGGNTGSMLAGNHHHQGMISGSISVDAPNGLIIKAGRKPRRRRTAFTHAQLAYLERKFRWVITNQLLQEAQDTNQSRRMRGITPPPHLSINLKLCWFSIFHLEEKFTCLA